MLKQRLPVKCNDTILHLEWVNDIIKEYPCQYTQTVIHATGICYSINMFPLKQILLPEFANLYV